VLWVHDVGGLGDRERRGSLGTRSSISSTRSGFVDGELMSLTCWDIFTRIVDILYIGGVMESCDVVQVNVRLNSWQDHRTPPFNHMYLMDVL